MLISCGLKRVRSGPAGEEKIIKILARTDTAVLSNQRRAFTKRASASPAEEARTLVIKLLNVGQRTFTSTLSYVGSVGPLDAFLVPESLRG